MATMSSNERDNLLPTDFAIPPKNGQPGQYPIKRHGQPDRAHAANALARAKQHASPEELAQVRAAVCKLFPDFPECSTNVQALHARMTQGKSGS